MPENEPEYSKPEKFAAALMALALLVFVLYGLTTGDVSSSRYPLANRATHPIFYWLHILIFAAGLVGAALISTGYVKRAPPPVAPPTEQVARNLALLAIVGSGGASYAWWTEATQHGRVDPVTGWLAVALLGMATWPPALSRGPLRLALRIAGTTAFAVAAANIYGLIR